jgi:cell division transport system ATP-binding protein
VIYLDNICKQYPGGHEALSQINLRLGRGQMAFLTGHSGAGKSTLLKLIAMIERPTRGQIFLDGVNLNNISNKKVPYIRRNIGIIFQNHHLLYDRTVFDNVAMPLIIQGYTRKEIYKRVRAALNQVGLLSREKSDPVTLSGGEQQRVGIARAIVHKPLLLLADEPTGNLDPELSQEIMKLFLRFNQVGTTVLIASHNIDLIRQIGSPMISLDDGKVVYNGLPYTAENTRKYA